MAASRSFRCGLYWQVRPKRRYACNTPTFLPLPLCHEFRVAIPSGLPLDIALMVWLLAGCGALSRQRAAPAAYSISGRGSGPGAQTLRDHQSPGSSAREGDHIHRSEADSARERGDWDALTRIIDAASYTLMLKKGVDAMLISAKRELGPDGPSRPGRS